MSSHILKYLILFVVVLASNKTYATAQYGDILIIKNDTTFIFSNPLEGYFNRKGSRTINNEYMFGACTALWRGYVATWLLENDSLFLIRIQTDYCGEKPIDLDIFREFGSSKVFASWTNTTIYQPTGDLIQYVHHGYMSIYEGESLLTFEDGILIKTEEKEFIEFSKRRLFPGSQFLNNTIKSMIISTISIDERKQIEDEDWCSIQFSFNEKGRVKRISLSSLAEQKSEFQTLLLQKAEAIKNKLPRLMKVKHDRYYPPIIEIWIDGYCLKNPYDTDYGCPKE